MIIPFSALNALEYCPRRFYYEYVQGEMLVNAFVLEGQLLHQGVDQPGLLTEKGVERIHRLYLCSERLRTAGYLDLLEEERGKLVPVEYKRGKEGRWLNDHIQLCAQALCLEEHLPHLAPLTHGYIFYFGSRRRQQVLFLPELRQKTQESIQLALELAREPGPPVPLQGKAARRCRDCSLLPLCLPEEVRALQEQEQEDTTGQAMPGCNLC
ncbi:CRISPR-associated protein Cas4 [Thermogemmatispora tikiterensis]|uniref:CRISPR-associated exonuclease Cas4 n=2 Tax=Thermogemmatispora tikiterensis TaxID=1825093 RepID=A0A328VHE0_9CHLR|nr:CRISPR-associated protein Cas4 [Thermogemmatispora tikiterensis]